MTSEHTGTVDPAVPTPEPGEISYGVFGENFIRRILHERRVLESVDRVLGEKIELGPMGAGPGRVFAKARATGWFHETWGAEIPGEHLTYRVMLPLDVDFEIELAKDLHRFRAQVLIPLTLTVRVEHPLTIVWDITPPDQEEVRLTLETDRRRSAVLQRVAGLDAELRRFMIRVIVKEFEKPHVRRATRIDMLSVIDGAWPALADRFLPPLDDAEAVDRSVANDTPVAGETPGTEGASSG